MNHGHHDHSSHHNADKPRRQIHKDWRIWVGVIVMLAALAVYVLTLDERFRPVPAPGPEPVTPAAPVR
jgi:hypothetical protein